MVSDHDGKLLRLDKVSAFAQSMSVEPPKLRPFRALQVWAILFAVIWLCAAWSLSQYLIERQIEKNLTQTRSYVANEINHLVKSLSQNLYQAEQISKTLSFDQSIIDLADYSKKHLDEYQFLNTDQRRDYMLAIPEAVKVNRLFKQLVDNLGLNQTFLLDAEGHCVGSSRAKQLDGCIGTNYQTREYFNNAQRDGNARQFAIGLLVPAPSLFSATAVKKDNEFLGVVVIRQEMEQILGFLNHQKNLSFITGADGIILGSSDPALNYQYVNSEFSPTLDTEEYRQKYKRDQVNTLSLEKTELPIADSYFIKVKDQFYILGHASVENDDFQIFILENIDNIIHNYENFWNIAIAILILGLALILMIERNLNYSQHRIAHLNALSEANKNLAHLTDELYALSVTDALTGLSNRRFFNEQLENEIQRAQRKSESQSSASQLALLVIDIDHFKSINDTYGHPAGDQAIRMMAKFCSDAVRQYDCVGRIGGEEFAVLLIDTNREQAKEIAERIRSQSETTAIDYYGTRFVQTCSIGIALFEPGDSANTLLSKADRALYAAKRAGRNQCVLME